MNTRRSRAARFKPAPGFVAAVACWLLIVGVLAGCGDDQTQTSTKVAPIAGVTGLEPIVIGYGAPELSAGQPMIMAGFVRRAEARGWQVKTANADFDARVQAEQIDFFIRSGVDAIVVVPLDSRGICESVQKARDAGIPFYTIDRAPIGCTINMTVLSDNYLAGKQAGEELVRLLTDRYGEPRGTILELQGNLLQNVALARGGGFHDVVDRYPEIEVIKRETDWEAERFASAAREVVDSVAVDAIYLHSDCVGVPVVLPVLAELGRKIPRGQVGHIFIAGVDGCAETLQAIRDGFVDQASSQPIPDFGIITRWIEMELTGQRIQAGEVVEEGALWSPAKLEQGETGWQLFLATTSVTPDNVDLPQLWGNQ